MILKVLSIIKNIYYNLNKKSAEEIETNNKINAISGQLDKLVLDLSHDNLKSIIKLQKIQQTYKAKLKELKKR